MWLVMKSHRVIMCSLAAAALTGLGWTQTRLDLRTQGKSIDFSSANSTLPSKAGTQLPSTCGIGETFLKTDAAPGANWYICLAGNQWTVQGTQFPAMSGKAGTVLSTDGSGIVWTAFGGDISGQAGSATVNRLLGRTLNPATPSAGQILTWDGTTWSPQNSPLLGVFGRTGAVSAQMGDYSFSQIGGTVGSSQLPAAGGDLSGNLATPTVARIQNQPVSSAAPGTGQVLTWNGTQWTPQTAAGSVTSLFGRTGVVTAQTGDYSFPQIAGTLASGQLPAAGGDLSGGLTAATVTRIQNQPVGSTTPGTGQVLTWSGTQWLPQASAVTSLFGRTGAVSAQTGDYSFAQISGTVGSGQLPSAGGDITGSLTAAAVSKIQGRPVGSAAPSTGQVLAWSGSQWAPQSFTTGVSTIFGRSGAITAQSGDYSFAQISGTVASGQLPSAGGDLTGSLTAATVSKIQGLAISNSTPATGQVLGWNGAQWAPQNGNSGVSSLFGRTGAVTAQNGDYSFTQISGTVSNGQLPVAGGDLAGSLTSATVTKLQGLTVGTTAPSAGQVLTWNGTQWAPQTAASAAVTSLFGRTGAVTAQAGDYAFPQIGGTVSGAQLPAAGGDLAGSLTSATVTKLQGQSVGTATPSTGQVLTWSGTQWTPQSAGVTSLFGRTGAVLAQAGDYTFPQIGGLIASAQLPAAGGDLSGSLTSATVSRIQNQPVASVTPSTGQVLTWSGIQWAPQSAGVTSLFGRTGAITAQAGDYSFAQIAGMVANAQLPGAGGDLSGSLSSATVSKIQNQPVSSTAPSSGQVLTWSGSQWMPQNVTAGVTSLFGRTGAVAAQSGDYLFSQIGGTITSAQLPLTGGDLAGSLTAATVSKIQNQPVSSVTPGSGQVLTWSGSQWMPQTPTSGVSSLFGRTGAVTAQAGDYSFAQIGGMVTSAQLPATGGDLSGGLTAATVAKIQNQPVATTAPSTGQVLTWNGNQWAAQNASGGVPSVFGRTGAVTPQTGDYSFSQISGTVTDSQIAAGVNASKVGSGTVSNQTFGYLSNVTSDVQAQLNALAGGSSVTTGGDLSGHLNWLTVRGLQNRSVDSTPPLDGQVLAWNAVANVWKPATIGSSGGGGGASMAAQLGDFGVSLVGPTALSVGANCSSATPCNIRYGNQVYSVTAPATVTVSGNTGAAFVYLDANGILTAGSSSLSLSCSTACTAVNGVSAFPVGVIPIYTWTATNGAWDANGGIDRRGWLSSNTVYGGTGIVTVQTGGQTMVAVDGGVVPTYLNGSAIISFPLIPAGTCSADQTFALPGANPGDAVTPGWPAALEPGLTGLMRVSASGTISVRLCADSTASVTPASATFTAMVVRGF
jgi:trimeric autotransporter adhesin